MSRNKNRIYNATKIRRTKRLFIIGAVILIYAFFFTSKLTIPQPLSEETFVGVPLRYTPDRGVIIYAATYDKEAELLEIVLNFSNSSKDNVNNYYFFAVASGRHNYDNLHVDVVYEDTLITVLRVPIRKFDEASIVFAPKVSDNIEEVPSNLVGTITFNRNNLKYDHIDTSRSREDYLIYRYESAVTSLKDEITEAKTSLENLKSRREALKAENADIEENMKYLTDEEKLAAKRKIKANESTRDEVNKSILEAENKIASLEEKYAEALSLYNKNFGKEKETSDD